MNVLSPEEQELIYKLYVTEITGEAKECNGDYELVNRLHKSGLLRKVKMRMSNRNELKLTDEGIVLAIILCRRNGDFALNKNLFIGYW